MLGRALGRKCGYAACALLAVGCTKLNDDPTRSTSSSHLECATPTLSQADVTALEVKLDQLVPVPPTPTGQPQLAEVPVHVHVLGDGKQSAIGAEQVKQQLEVLNGAFELAGFHFSLASSEVTLNDAWSHATPDSKEEHEMKAALHQGGAGDLNLYLAPFAPGLFGWSSFPWTYASAPDEDGVIVSQDTVPGGSAPGHQSGGSAVHEVRHWLGLYHTFQTGCDAPGDAVKDTPRAKGPTFGCPTQKDTCPVDDQVPDRPDPFQNYMDYTDDSCRFELSPGQAARMNRLWKLRSGGSCGNGLLDLDETCDTAISPGNARSRPAARADGAAGTTDMLVSAGTCTASCEFVAVTVPANGDACCPPGANANTDLDCAPVCGNAALEPGEECDDGNTADGDGCSQYCKLETPPPTGFRLDALTLEDPHVYAWSSNCVDATQKLDTDLSAALNKDGDGDGLLDFSPVLAFKPLDPKATSSPLDFVAASCAVATQSCSGVGAAVQALNAKNQASGTCLGALPGTTTSAYGTPNQPTGQCFSSNPATIAINLQGVTLTLHDAQIAAVYTGTGGLTTGLIRGFLTQSDALAIVVPWPLFNGAKLADALASPGSKCGAQSDLDYDSSGQPGWYFYLNFTAAETSYKM